MVFTLVRRSASKRADIPCTSPFYIWQEPQPFFVHLKEKSNRKLVQFTREHELLKYFPDELALGFVYLKDSTPVASCTIIDRPFDPATIKFEAAWRNGVQRLPAKGVTVPSFSESESLWCEDRCGGVWKYELRVESEAIPLTDRLEVRIRAADGSLLAEFIGELGPDALEQIHP